MKKCPYCAEEIQDEAIKCKYCREWLSEKEKNTTSTDIEKDTILIPKNDEEFIVARNEPNYEINIFNNSNKEIEKLENTDKIVEVNYETYKNPNEENEYEKYFITKCVFCGTEFEVDEEYKKDGDFECSECNKINKINDGTIEGAMKNIDLEILMAPISYFIYQFIISDISVIQFLLIFTGGLLIYFSETSLIRYILKKRYISHGSFGKLYFNVVKSISFIIFLIAFATLIALILENVV